MATPFQERLQGVNPEYETFGQLRTLQINLGNQCNLNCTHCHVDASARGAEIMGRNVMDQITGFLKQHPGLVLDITGGAPEMNPDFRYLVETTEGLAASRLLRSNLAIMTEPGWEWLPEYCHRHRLIIIGSLPCYLEENVDRQRGGGVFLKCITALKRLNRLGYGSELELNLVYNPGGDFVPGSQQGLETAYKSELLNRHGIIFNRLFTITNAPIGRFRKQLETDGTYAEYLRLLSDRFNPAAAENIMCRSLISVDWQGAVYNCDFNQALKMPILSGNGAVVKIDVLDTAGIKGKKNMLSQHCYCCTAGEGSSCTGALTS